MSCIPAMVGVDPKIDAEGKTEEEMRQAARDFIDRFMQPGKPCFFHYTMDCCTPAFCEELYAYSRKKACNEVKSVKTY